MNTLLIHASGGKPDVMQTGAVGCILINNIARKAT